MMPSEMWILAFVVVPLIVLILAGIIVVISDHAARKHKAEARRPPLYHP
jgi:hypothetical protein